MKNAESEHTVSTEEITTPKMSRTPRRITALRSALLAALVLTGLGFATAVYFDNSDGELTDASGVIGNPDA